MSPHNTLPDELSIFTMVRKTKRSERVYEMKIKTAKNAVAVINVRYQVTIRADTDVV